jgi:GT2 family glycosyltransferase
MRPSPVAVAILFFERAAQTVECIRSFLPAGVPIYVLNNGSSAAETRRLEAAVRRDPAVTLLHARRNVGVSAGRNRLVRSSREPWLFFADNDATMRTRSWRAAFRAHAAAHPRTEVFLPRLFNVHDRSYERPVRLTLRGRELRVDVARGVTTNCFPGGACLVKRTLFERLGLFDERMFVGFEDYELAIRGLLRPPAVRVRTLDDVELAHEHRPATTRVERAAARVRYSPRHIAHSHRRLTSKHGITFPTGWPGWAARQLAFIGAG